MIFTFWTADASDPDSAEVPKSAAIWRALYPDMRVYSLADAAEVLQPFGAAAVDLFHRIRIPACQSDLARLLLLYRHGGLYVDSHTGPGEFSGLLDIFRRLAAYELVVFEKPWERQDANDLHLINTALAARRGAGLIRLLIESALANLSQHAEKEGRTDEHAPYNIFSLTGAWDIRMNLFEAPAGRLQVKPVFRDAVDVCSLSRGPESGLRLYQFYDYRKPGRHWSERQKTERLFG